MKKDFYKLNPEIKEFILQKAKEHPELGCRKLSSLIMDTFKVEVSKSSVSTILKSEGLNKSVGRRGVKSQVTGHRSQVAGYRLQVTDSALPAGRHSPQSIGRETLLLSSHPQSNLLTHLPEPANIQASLPVIASERSERSNLKEIASSVASLPPRNDDDIKTKPPLTYPHIGCWFLKAADLCLGGTQAIAGALASAEDLSGFVETLLYLPLCGKDNYQDLGPASKEAMAVITGKIGTDTIFPDKNYISCSIKDRKIVSVPIFILEQARAANPQILNQLLSQAREISKLKFTLEDNSFFFLDAGSHTVWSAGRIPECFSTGLSKTKAYLNGSILENTDPLVLQALAGFDAPTPASLNFIASFQSEKTDKAIKRIELYSVDNLLIDTIQSLPQRKRPFIFGLWPWQYKNMDREAGLLRSLRSLAMTDKDNRKILDIITNLEESQLDNEKIIGHYLGHWPNLESGYQDFLDKIGHFYQLSRSKIMHKNNVHFSEGKDLALNEILSFWRWELNSYCQKYFFPLSCQRLDFLALKERFYELRGRIITEADYLKVIFELPQGFLHTGDLVYGCQRVNEADIQLMDGRRLRFEA